MPENRVFFGGSMSDRGNQILHNIASKRKFGENDQIGFLLSSPVYKIEVLFKIGFDIPQFCGNLC
jgi:hypothetical protein